MDKGIKTRLDIHNILFNIYKSNWTLGRNSIQKIVNKNTSKDIAFINNVTLSSMRYQFHTKKILKNYVRKKLKDHERILLTSAITQIVFLKFKPYAVVNCSVEIAKKLNIYHGLINACLKKISNDKEKLNKTKINFDDLPLWFIKQTKNLKHNEKIKISNNVVEKPDLHLVFKNKKVLKEFEEQITKTSDVSGFFNGEKK